MAKKILMVTLFFYLLTLLQTSFFPLLSNYLPNLILISTILISLFEAPKSNLGVLSALIGGFFLDIFSENFIGFYILISLSLYLFIKFFLKEYVQTPIFKKI